jgi:hypothetical protein
MCGAEHDARTSNRHAANTQPRPADALDHCPQPLDTEPSSNNRTGHVRSRARRPNLEPPRGQHPTSTGRRARPLPAAARHRTEQQQPDRPSACGAEHDARTSNRHAANTQPRPDPADALDHCPQPLDTEPSSNNRTGHVRSRARRPNLEPPRGQHPTSTGRRARPLPAAARHRTEQQQPDRPCAEQSTTPEPRTATRPTPNLDSRRARPAAPVFLCASPGAHWSRPLSTHR